MSDGTGRRLREAADLFDEASELESAERAAYLARLEAQHPELAAEVLSLFAAERELGDFLERPAVEGIEMPSTASAEDDWLGRRLGPYEILEPLGRGGMGQVYRALDHRLERPVAIKVLTASGHLDERARQRFEREARAIAALDHSSLCTLHDIGRTENGELYLVMTYYPGQTLRQRLTAGPLGTDQAIEITLAIAEGLAVAHEAGIVHRDIKPSNVLITERGDVKVLDFGIASRSQDETLTRTREVPGTPAYMAPEQRMGGPSGPASDVWALGVLLFEMLTGERPPGAGGPSSTEAGPDLDRRLGSSAVRATLSSALDPDPSRRWPDAGAFAEALRRSRRMPRPPLKPLVLGGAALVGLGVVLLGVLFVRELPGERLPETVPYPAPTPPDSAERTGTLHLSVHPFANGTGDPALDQLTNGVSRLVRDALSASRHLHVASELGNAPTPLAGDETSNLRNFIVEGEILATGTGYLLTARVLEPATGRQLAATRSPASEGAGLYAAVDDVARAVRRALALPTDEAVDIFAADFAGRHPEAYDHYLEGLEHLTAYRYEGAESAFLRALEVTPDFTMARYRLGQVLASRGQTVAALEHLHRALAESPSLDDREALYVRASALMVERKNGEAAQVLGELLTRYPYEGDAMHLRALALRSDGQLDEAVEVLDRLTHLEPRRAVAWSLRGSVELARGQPQAAIESLGRYLTLDPDSANGHHLLGDAYRSQGELDWALEAYQRALATDPSFHFASVQLAVTEALKGDEERALNRLVAVIEDPAIHPRPRLDATFEAVFILRGSGRMREALRRLEAAEPLLAEEQVRYAFGLHWRALCHLDLGELSAARRLATQAALEPPGRPYRYQVARALVELADGDLPAFDESLTELLTAGDDPTAQRSAAYLRGRRLLAGGRAREAERVLRRAVMGDGYPYAVYRVSLAEALLAAGRPREAETAARQASEPAETGVPRLDLRLDRRRALVSLARAQVQLERPEEARETVRRLQALWRDGDRDFAALRHLRILADQLKAPGANPAPPPPHVTAEVP